MTTMECQEEIITLSDKSPKTGKERPWAKHKRASEYMAMAYECIGDERKAQRIRDCATWTEWEVSRMNEDVKHLKTANFCRVRLCPMCMWRRSIKTFGQMYKIISYIGDKYAYIKLNLTQKNISGNELSDELNRLSQAWHRFIGYAEVKRAVKGFYRATEVVHNVDPKSSSFDTYHPHFHCLLAVNKSYFTSRDYISHKRWQELWAKAMRLDYLPNVWTKKMTNKFTTNDDEQDLKSAIAELGKYTCKPEEIILPQDWQMTEDAVKILDKALTNRRFIAMGGVIKEAHKALNLDDMEDGDLVHTTDDNLSDEEKEIVYYEWHSGYSQYVKTDKRR